jgi:hypothetical protein
VREQEVSKKAKRRAAETSFSLSRRFRKISTARPSSLVISIIVISYAVFLFGGGLYTVISSPLPAFYTGRGFIGLLAVYQSTKYAYNPRQAYMMLVIGVTLLLLAYIFLEDTILIKLGR